MSRHGTQTNHEDPEANGLAEAYMKIVKKIWHTCSITRRDPMAEINKRLQAYRATPHPTTGKAPAELMYGGRTYRSRLPDKKENAPSAAVAEAQETDRRHKSKQKEYKDRRQYVKPHDFRAGDLALLAQKQTKRNPPYDPRPYRVTNIRGHQITGQRNGKLITRDAQKWKKLREKKEQLRRADSDSLSSDDDIFPRELRDLKSNSEGAQLSRRGLGTETRVPHLEESTADQAPTGETTVDVGSSARPTTPEDNTTTTGGRRITRSQGTSFSWNPIMNDTTGPLINPAPP